MPPCGVRRSGVQGTRLTAYQNSGGKRGCEDLLIEQQQKAT